MSTISNVLCHMRQKSTQPMEWAIAFVTTRVFDTKHMSHKVL
jgi:hypothetical protein